MIFEDIRTGFDSEIECEVSIAPGSTPRCTIPTIFVDTYFQEAYSILLNEGMLLLWPLEQSDLVAC